MKLSKEKLIEMLRKMLAIRHFEEAIHYVYAQGWMPGLAHLYIGQEAIAVGVCKNLRKDDYITSTHRGHGHLIAKGGDLNKMMAEVMGKSTGYCKGKGGSMHIAAPELGIMGANGIVGGSIPIATGLGLSSKLKKDGRVTVCFFGEGASNQGAFHEGLNMASLWHLPIVYICENNLYAISVSQKRSQNIKDVAIRGAAYGIPGEIVDGNDVLAVCEKAQKAINYAREGNGPILIECKTYRWGGHHVGDPGTAYRPSEEVKTWKEKCPIKRFKLLLIKEKRMTQSEIDIIEDEVKQRVDKAIKFAKNSPYPSPEEALDDVFAKVEVLV
jgi:pyruvate dehydrogenase E1 component alpha subunit